MNVSEVRPLGFHDSTSVSFEVKRVPATHQEWSEAIGELPLETLLGPIDTDELVLAPHAAESYSMTRKIDNKARDWWAGDHLWHVDGTRWPVQPVYTVIACKQADAGSPPTELFDTVRLSEILDADGFWQRNGVEPEQVPELQSIFADSTYYREALPFMRKMAGKTDQELIADRVRADLEENNVDTLEAYADILDTSPKYQPKSFSTVRDTPLEKLPALFIDGGGRNTRLVSPDGTDYTHVLHALRREYLTGYGPQKRGLVRTIGWTANRCIIFPQVGTLHRALPGNEHQRMLHLGFLVDKNELERAEANGEQ